MAFFEFPNARTFDSDLTWIIDKIKDLINNYQDLIEQIITMKNSPLDWVSVKEYGAKGDGEQNESNSFNRAYEYSKENGYLAIYIPTGTYFLTEDVGDVNTIWIIGNNTKFTGDLPVIHDGLMQNTGHLKGTIFFLRDKGGVRVGSSTGWLETQLRYASEVIAALNGISTTGRYGLIGASRSSDLENPAVSSATTIGLGGFALNDETNPPVTVWCGYFDGLRNEDSGILIGNEIDLGGKTPVQPLLPYAQVTNENPIVVNLWLSSGHGSATPAEYGTSGAIGIIRNPIRHQVGICVKSDALDANNVAIALAKSHRINFYDSDDAINSPYMGTYARNFMRLVGDSSTDNYYIISDDVAGSAFNKSHYIRRTGDSLTEVAVFQMSHDIEGYAFNFTTSTGTWKMLGQFLLNPSGNIGTSSSPIAQLVSNKIVSKGNISINDNDGYIGFADENETEQVSFRHSGNNTAIIKTAVGVSLIYNSSNTTSSYLYVPNGYGNLGNSSLPWNHIYLINEPIIVSAPVTRASNSVNMDALKTAISKIKPYFNGKNFSYDADAIRQTFSESGLNSDEMGFTFENGVCTNQILMAKEYFGKD